MGPGGPGGAGSGRSDGLVAGGGPSPTYVRFCPVVKVEPRQGGGGGQQGDGTTGSNLDTRELRVLHGITDSDA